MATDFCYVGIDLQAQGLDLVLLDKQAKPLGALHRQYSASKDADPHQLDPQDWWRAVRTGIKELLRRHQVGPEQVRGVGISGISDGAVLVDAEGEVLGYTAFGPGPSADAGLDLLVSKIGDRNLRNLTSRQAGALALAPRYLSQASTDSRAEHDLALLLQPADFIRYRFTGEASTDFSLASRSLLFSPRNRSWSKQLLSRIDLTPAQLPTVYPGSQLVGRVTEAAGRESGLQAGTPVVGGATQLAAMALAIGADEPGTLALEVGGAGGAYAPVEQLHKDLTGMLDAGCHPIDQRFCLETAQVCAADDVFWLANTVMPNEVQAARRQKRTPLDHLAEMAAETHPGADGLLFLGSDRGLAGGFVGLSQQHGRGHLVRAVLEHGALTAAAVVERLHELHTGPESIVVTGECASNALWCQMIADACNRPVHVRLVEAPAATGVAQMVAVATGGVKNLDAARRKGPKVSATYQPRKAAFEAYQAIAPLRQTAISALDIGSEDDSDEAQV